MNTSDLGELRETLGKCQQRNRVSVLESHGFELNSDIKHLNVPVIRFSLPPNFHRHLDSALVRPYADYLPIRLNFALHNYEAMCEYCFKLLSLW